MSDRGVDAVVETVLSRLVGEYRGRQGKDLNVTARVLVMYGEPGLLSEGTRVGAQAGMQSLELSRSDLNERWEELRFTRHELACFPTQLLAELIEPAAWPGLRQLIEDGPRSAVRKVETALYRYSRTEVRATTARPQGGRVTRQTVELRRDAYRRIMRILRDLHTLQYPAAALEPWSAVPPIQIPDIVPERTDRSAPQLDLVRAVVQQLDREIDERLGATETTKLAAIERLSPVQLFQAGVARNLRHLVTIALLATLGPRVSALAAVRADDYDPRHRFPDGNVGPALRFYPGKTVHRDLARWKGLAPKEADLVEALLLLTRRLYSEREPTARKNSWRTVDPPRAMPEDWALLASRIFKPGVAPSGEALTNMLTGQPTGYAKLPLAEHLGSGAKGRLGHSGHRVRHLAEQLVRIGISRYLEERAIQHVSCVAVAEVVLDHDVKEDRYGYSDLNSEHGRENWGRIAALATSRLLWTDEGARRVPDLHLYERALRHRKRLEKQLAVVEDQRSAARGRAVPGLESEVAALRETIALAEDAESLRRELNSANYECTRLEDRTAWRPLRAGSPVDPSETDPQAALVNTRRRVRAGEATGGPLRLLPVRQFVSVPELASLLEISDATAKRLVCGGPSDSPSWPFTADTPPVDVSRGARRRRVWTGGLTDRAVSGARRARLERLLSEYPAGWRGQDVVAPLVLPEPYARAREAPCGPAQAPEHAPLRLAASADG